MAIKLGTTDINKLYLGATEINKAELGSTEVYSPIEEINNPNANLRVITSFASWGTTGAETSDLIPANTTGSLTFAASSGTTGFNYPMIGFTASAETPSAHYTSINFCLYASSQSFNLIVYENGAGKGNVGTYTFGDRVGVHRDGSTGVITYTKNGTTLYTSNLTTTGELKGDFAFFQNTKFENILMERGNGTFNPFYTNMVNVTNY